jgi:hypothetical protein
MTAKPTGSGVDRRALLSGIAAAPALAATLRAGIGGVAALSVAQGVSRAQSMNAGAGITAVGVDGADLTARYLHDYLSVGATVWQYSQNTIDFDRFDTIDSFVDANIDGHAGQVLQRYPCRRAGEQGCHGCRCSRYVAA